MVIDLVLTEKDGKYFEPSTLILVHRTHHKWCDLTHSSGDKTAVTTKHRPSSICGTFLIKIFYNSNTDSFFDDFILNFYM